MNECPECDGSGVMVVTIGHSRWTDLCPTCDGTGLIFHTDEERA